jgi:hypothetical protein
MGCCCQDRTERPESREERIVSLRRALEEAQRQLDELENEEEAA